MTRALPAADRKLPSVGAPIGEDESNTSAAVRQMFSDIAPRYDLLNHLLSCNIDRLWWRRTARIFAYILRRDETRALDLCCGTGDMAKALRKQTPRAQIIGIDFSRGMLTRGRRKFDAHCVSAVESDALHLPFRDRSFDVVVSAFGLRNLANYDAGLREIHRVLRPDGEIGVLDFSEPGGLLGKVYGFYFRKVLPRIGTLISGVTGPYSYLPASVSRFPAPNALLERMSAIGYTDVQWQPYSFGIAGLYRGRK